MICISAIITSGMGGVSQEPHLTAPSNILDSARHNMAVAEAIDSHALILVQTPSTIIGQPMALSYMMINSVGIVKRLKGFWNVTKTSLNEALQGISNLPIHPTKHVGTAPLDGDNHGRIAIEQAYGISSTIWSPTVLSAR